MNTFTTAIKIIAPAMRTLALATALLLSATSISVFGKGGSDKDNRSEFYGIIEVRPSDMAQGTWVIGERTVTPDAATEFDQSEGDLTPGSCAKVKLRNGRVHEIDSEPIGDCR